MAHQPRNPTPGVCEYIGDLLKTTGTPILIVGDIGMRANYLLGQPCARNDAALIYNLARDSQMALSTPMPGWKQQVRDLAQSADILIFEYTMESSDALARLIRKREKKSRTNCRRHCY